MHMLAPVSPACTTVFVLVVPASNNIFADYVFGLVVAKGKAPKTLLVLSMLDIAAHNDAAWHTNVVPRLLGTDAELASYGFKCVVGTMCRQQDVLGNDPWVLRDMDEIEHAWAANMIARTGATDAERTELGRNTKVCRAYRVPVPA
jgi:hypothetical protein